MKEWRCDVCGFVATGEEPPADCPVCKVDASNFSQVGGSTADEGNKSSDDQLKNIKTSIRQLIYGMYIITTKSGDKINGQTANTVFQLTSEPNQLGIALNNGNYTNELVKESKEVAVHVMGQDSLGILGHFGFQSGRTVNKFESYAYVMEDNLPLLKEEALSIMKGHVVNSMDVGSHTLFVVEVEDAFVNADKKGIQPMSYSDFRTLKKGGTLNSSVVPPVEDKGKKVEGSEGSMDMTKYVCSVCGYVHDPAVEGVAFADLPDSYVCPVCGVGKDQFEPEA